jgi:hypothetical protein
MDFKSGYELFCDSKTYRWNANVFMNRGTMYYVDDNELIDIKAECITEMAEDIRRRRQLKK